MMTLRCLCCLLLAVFHSWPAAAQEAPRTILLVPDRVFTAVDRVGHPGWKVLVAGGKIVAVGPDLAAPAGAETLALPGTTLLPGLIDLHVHLFLHP